MSTLQLILVSAVSAAAATAAVGFALGHLVEVRLKAMRDLFGMALVQRDSFDAALRDRDARIDSVHGRVDLLDQRHADVRQAVDGHEARIARLEGKRIG